MTVSILPQEILEFFVSKEKNILTGVGKQVKVQTTVIVHSRLFPRSIQEQTESVPFHDGIVFLRKRNIQLLCNNVRKDLKWKLTEYLMNRWLLFALVIISLIECLVTDYMNIKLLVKSFLAALELSLHVLR